jgi:hypothetical protein
VMIVLRLLSIVHVYNSLWRIKTLGCLILEQHAVTAGESPLCQDSPLGSHESVCGLHTAFEHLDFFFLVSTFAFLFSGKNMHKIINDS